MKFVLVLLSCLLLIACGGDDEPISTPSTTLTPSALQTASVTTVGTVPPAPTLNPPLPGGPSAPPFFTPEVRPTDTVWLFDVASGKRTTLLEDPTQSVGPPRFSPDDTVTVTTLRPGSQAENVRLRFDGSIVSRVPVPPPSATAGDCLPTSSDAVILGRLYRNLSCGQISPDRRWMTYQVDAGTAQVVQPSPTSPSGYSVPVWDQWVVELATDQRRLLQAGLLHCGGCDGRFGPSWSPSGRLLYFAELRSYGTTFISDIRSGETRKLFSGATEISAEPDWSPIEDVLVYRSSEGPAMLEDFTSGTRAELTELSWPVRFDTSGAYLFSPAWRSDSKTVGGETKVYDWKARRLLAILQGQPRNDGLFMPGTPILAIGGTFLAVLEGAADCGGVAVYRGSSRVACVTSSRAGLPSSDGNFVAVAREIVPSTLGRLAEYEIVLIDVASGSTRTIAGGARSDMPPELVWSEDSSHILAKWPFGTYGP